MSLFIEISIADAVSDGDAEMAVLISKWHTALVNSWLDEVAVATAGPAGAAG